MWKWPLGYQNWFFDFLENHGYETQGTDNLGVECNFDTRPTLNFTHFSKVVGIEPKSFRSCSLQGLKALVCQYFLHTELIKLSNKILQFVLYPKSNQNLEIQPKYNALSICIMVPKIDDNNGGPPNKSETTKGHYGGPHN
jgi:hypothetical protein